MILKDVGMLAVSSNRTKFYLHQMIKYELLPSFVLYMDSPSDITPEERAIKARANDNDKAKLPKYNGFDMNVSVLDLLADYKIPSRVVPATDPNLDEVVEALKGLKQSIIIYSGPGGAILKKEILTIGKRFLHIHPGLLPQYRGSTTIYYSLINEGTCGATALFLDKKIDAGPVIRKRSFPAPDDRATIDLHYDSFIRSELLIDVLQCYAKTGAFSTEHQEVGAGETYYIIHPVLKHIAIMGSN